MLIIDEKELDKLRMNGWRTGELGAKKSERQVFTAAEDLGADAIHVLSWGTGRALRDVAALEGYDIDFSVVPLPAGRDIAWVWRVDGYFQAVLIEPMKY